MNRLPLILLTLLLLVGVASASGLEGAKAPDFTLKTMDGGTVSLSDLTDKGPVLLDFWATWCQPCKQALPHMDKIYTKYKDQGYSMLAVSVDNTRSVGRVRSYVKGQGFSFPVALDTDSEVLRKYRGINVPYTVLIDTDGTVRKVWMSYHPGEEKVIEAEVASMLNAGEGDE